MSPPSSRLWERGSFGGGGDREHFPGSVGFGVARRTASGRVPKKPRCRFASLDFQLRAGRTGEVQVTIPPGARDSGKRSEYGMLFAVTCMSLAFGSYFVLRYLGLWSEQDTAVFARAIAGLRQAGRLYNSTSYSHGYAFPAWAVGLSELTGLKGSATLQLYLPLLGNLLLGVFGFVTFRKLLASDGLALLAAAMLFLVPELVFSVSRGNHQKLDLSLTLLALLALLGSFLELFNGQRRWSVFASWVGTYYLAAFTLVTVNAFFGSSVIVAATLTLGFTFLAVRLGHRDGRRFSLVVQRLVLVSGVSWLIVALVMLFVYPPAGHSLVLLRTTLQRLAALFLSLSPKSSAFPPATTSWASTAVYGLLSSFRWTLFVGSFVTWLYLLWRALNDMRSVPLERLFLHSLYLAFGLELVFAIPVDLVGLQAGTNLQVRLYIYFALLAAPVLAVGLAEVRRRLRTRNFGRGASLLIGAALIGFTMVSLLKSTLDPAVSNNWMFYRPSEVEAMHFWDQRSAHASLWVGVAGRLQYASAMSYPLGSQNGNSFDILGLSSASADALRSPVIEAAAVATREAPPVLWLGDRVFDDGETQIYHRVPRTPFQH